MPGKTTVPTESRKPTANTRQRKPPRMVQTGVPTPDAAPTRNRRRPALIALAVALLALSALGGWAAFRSVSATVL